MLIRFRVKVPLIPFHAWLPEAHVEAPTVGSVVLARLILKLGTFGILKFNLFMLPTVRTMFITSVRVWGCVSLIGSRRLTFWQLDLKRIVAYSSISHMAVVVIGLRSVEVVAVTGAYLFRVTHRIVSAAMFFLIGRLYKRYHSRLILNYSGLIQVRPLFGVRLFLFVVSNFNFPLTGAFVSERLVLIGVGKVN
jgi:NADH-quinone oxidoreductase subunit M